LPGKYYYYYNYRWRCILLR